MLEKPLSRRVFLRLAGGTAAFSALARPGAVHAAALTARGGEPVFDAAEREILARICERMVETGEPAAPALRQTRALETIEALCRGLDAGVRRQLRLALRLFEYGPFVFDWTFARFTRMSDAECDASLTAWMTSRLALRRTAFLALRNLALYGYYSQPETWPLVGYAGPLLGRKGGAAPAPPPGAEPS
jgi:hypothetical protein